MPTPPRNAPLSTSTFRSSILRSVRLTALVLFSMGVFTGQALGLEPSGELEIHYINVSQGGSTLVIGPDGTSVLLDMGKRGKGNAAIVPYLMSIGLDPEDGIDFALAGNLDADHIGGFPEITAAGYDIEQGNWFNGSTKGTLTAGRYHDACEATTAGRASVPAVGAVIELGDGARLTVVAAGGYVPGMPPITGKLDENDMSLAVVIQHGAFDYVWACELGGGDDDSGCTGRVTGQRNLETPLAQALVPGGAMPLLSEEGVDVMHVNHHGSESSTNADWMNFLRPEVAVIPVGAGQGSNWHHPRRDVVENVLLAQAACITVPAAFVLQTEEGSVTGEGTNTSTAGFCVGDIAITTNGRDGYRIEGSGRVTHGPDEREVAGLPRMFETDEAGPVDPVEQVNLARGKETHAANYDSTAYKMTDGEDRWWYSAMRDDQWVSVDLGAVHDLSQVAIDWKIHAREFVLEVSIDGERYEEVDEFVRFEDGRQEIAVGGWQARFVRLTLLERSDTRYKITELEVFGDPAALGAGGPDPVADPDPTQTCGG